MAIKFKLIETGLDAVYNVTVSGYYVDGTTQVSGTRVFSFDPTEVSLQGMQDVVSAAQPIPNTEDIAKKEAAETALAKLDSFVGTDVTLDAPIEPEV